MPKPANQDEFTIWSTVETCGVFTSNTRTLYELSRNNLYTVLTEHSFFTTLPDLLASATAEYQGSRNTALFAFHRKQTLEWNKKTYESFVEKLYRWNCVENSDFPTPPTGGWINLTDSFNKIDDIIRTTIVVAYADGPEFLARAIERAAVEAGLRCTIKDHTHEKGYYAYHVYINLKAPIAPLDGTGPIVCEAFVEIQITTELQAALRELTHKLYEEERLRGELQPGWKQDFESNRFRAAYMAHSLRFIEAMIVDLRTRIHKGKIQ